MRLCTRLLARTTLPMAASNSNAKANASRHPPFKQVEAGRPDFEQTLERVFTKTPQPNWKPGDGLNDATQIPGHANFKAGAKFRQFDPKQMTEAGKAGDVYKIMIGGIVPRPICFCSTVSLDGKPNLAPFSYFNAICHNPPLIMFAATGRKDTRDNVKATKEFVANIISEPFIEAANYCSISAPNECNEWVLSGLTPVASKIVKPARVGESAFAMECTLEHSYDINNDDGSPVGTAFIGRVKLIHVRDDVIDENLVIDPAKLLPVSRLGGITYGRSTNLFELPRSDLETEKTARPESAEVFAKSVAGTKL